MMNLLLLAALAAASPVPGQERTWPLTPDGYGPVLIGMTRDQVAAALGTALEGEAIDDANVCVEMGAVRGYPDLYFMFENGLLSRVSAGERSAVRTARGIGIGASAAEVRRTYGRTLRAEPHTYRGLPAEYLTAWVRRNRSGLRFETGTDRRVHTIHAGNATIQYIEGCA